MINQIRASRDFIPSFVGILASIIAVALSYIEVNGHAILPSQHIILTGLSLGIFVMIFIGQIFRPREAK
jgi:hypothetical protein